MKLFKNRQEAGRELAKKLAINPITRNGPLCVVALPRGGVPVAAEIAKAFHAPLDVLLVRKLGVPRHPELAFGAIASGNALLLNRKTIEDWSISEALVKAVIKYERHELNRRASLYLGHSSPLDVQGRTVILVDDGIATGATMRAAIEVLLRQRPAHLIIAVPVAPAQTCKLLRERVDALITLIEPQSFDAVGLWYIDFTQVSDEKVQTLLRETRSASAQVAKYSNWQGQHQGATDEKGSEGN